jgi:spermidine synthase
MPSLRGHHRLIGLLFFLSGFTALTYELLWVRKVALIVGVHAYAVSTVLASFFLGMAAGAFLFGERGGRRRNPVRTYALLEVGIAVSAAAVSWLLDHPLALHRALAFIALPSILPSGLVRFGFLFLVLLVPTSLMGGTLPILSRAVVARGETLGREIGRLYALNTFGGALGVLASAFLLVRAFGVNATLAAAVGVNVLVAATALWWARRPAAAAEAEPSRAAAEDPATHRGRRVALALFALSGFASLASEVIWTRILIQGLRSRLLAFAMVLAVFLLGIVGGSWAASGRVGRLRSAWRLYAFVQLALALGMVGGGLLLRPLAESWSSAIYPALLARGLSSEVVWLEQITLVPAAVLAVPTFLMGFGFPLVVTLCGRRQTIEADVGRLYVVNTLGGVAGSLIAGFVLIPRLGTQTSLLSVASLSVLAALAAGAYGFAARRVRLLLVAGALAGWFGVLRLIPPDFIRQTYVGRFPGEVVFHEEGVEGTAVIYEQMEAGQRFRRLVINGSSNSGDTMASLRYMRLQAHLPVLLHPGEAQDVLVICLGTGITYGSVFHHPARGRRVCVELSGSVVRGAAAFAASNGGVLARPDSEVVIADGRHFLLSDPSAFDVITLEPPPPNTSGAVNLYTPEFYRLCKARLRPDGVMAQWLPLHQKAAELKMIARAFVDEFPHTSLWTTELQETLLVGTVAPLRIDFRRLEAKMAAPAVARDLEAIGVRSAPELLSLFLLDDRALRAYVAESPAVSDDWPRLEYSLASETTDYPQILAELLDRRSPIGPYLANVADPDAVLYRIAQHAEVLDTFYRSGLVRDPRNAYFLSFLDPEVSEAIRRKADSVQPADKFHQ